MSGTTGPRIVSSAIRATLDRLTGSDDVVFYECRHCGRSYGSDVAECSACESTEIARYEF